MHVQRELDQLYQILEFLRERLDGGRTLEHAMAADGWPRRGIYFFFEDGELRSDVRTPRLVRVGTHGVARTRGTALWQRLAQHRGSLGGHHPGGGNHRGSVFRHHVGGAMIRRGDFDSRLLTVWSDMRPKEGRRARELEYPIELAVSKYIRSMNVLWVDVLDEVAKESHRKTIERGAIALLGSAARARSDPPSPSWLGRWVSPAPYRSRGSGMCSTSTIHRSRGSWSCWITT